MKGQRIRYQQTGEFHFLTFSCYRRRPYLAAVEAGKGRLSRHGLPSTGAGSCRSGCATGSQPLLPRSPKARDRGHPQLDSASTSGPPADPTAVGRELALVFSGLRLRENQRMRVRLRDRQCKQVGGGSGVDLRIDEVSTIRRPTLGNGQRRRAKQEFLWGCAVRRFSIDPMGTPVSDVAAIGRLCRVHAAGGSHRQALPVAQQIGLGTNSVSLAASSFTGVLAYVSGQRRGRFRGIG